jgi:UDP-glucuronate 4-epimerase
LNTLNILVTGGAGFIGSHLVGALLDKGHKITVVDNFDDFYSRELKELNIRPFINHSNLTFKELDILDADALREQLTENFDAIIHLAAKAGVRPSIQNPLLCQQVNVSGTQNMLEFAKDRSILNFVFASSSSVYGVNKNYPWRENDATLNPISPYASTKVSGELLGHVYCHLYGIKFKGLRFFTVYGPRQRPDLAIRLFVDKIIKGEPINVFGEGNTQRDYTFVDDIVEGIIAALHYKKTNFEIFNLGNHETISLNRMIRTLEKHLGLKAIINRMPEQDGDVPITFADISKAQALLDYHPSVKFDEGVYKFIRWYKSNK